MRPISLRRLQAEIYPNIQTAYDMVFPEYCVDLTNDIRSELAQNWNTITREVLGKTLNYCGSGFE